MNVKTDQAGACRLLVDVSLGADEIKEDYNQVVAVFSRGASIPGFRPGKAPRAMVETRYRKQIQKELQDVVLPRAYREVLEQEKLQPVALIDVRNLEIGADTGMQFSLVLDVPPTFKLPKYRKIVVQNQATDVTEAEIDEAIQSVLRRMARYGDAESGPIEDQDLVQIDYQGTAADGTDLELGESAENGKELLGGEDFWLPVAGDNELIPGLTEALKGHEVGQTFGFDAMFPEDFRVASLAGKPCCYQITVKGHRKLVVPELNEEILKRMEVESEAALRTRIQTDLEAVKREQAENRKREQVSQYLLENTKLEVPASVVEQERTALLRSLLTRMAQQGATREMLDQHRDDIMASVSRQAEERVKLRYILESIAEEEQIQVSPEDGETAMQAMASQHGMPVEKLRAEIDKQEDGLEHFQQDVRRDKVYAFLLAEAKIKD